MEADVETMIRQNLSAEGDVKFVKNCKWTDKYGADDSDDNTDNLYI